MMRDEDITRSENIRRNVPFSAIYPDLRDVGSSNCPVCGGKGKFYVRDGWARCFKTTCDLTLSNQGKSLDVIALYRYKNGLYGKGSFYKAMDQLEAIHGLSGYKEREEERSSYLDQVMEVYQQELFSSRGKRALEYMRARGFTKEILETTGVGYASHDSVLREYGFDPTELRTHNLISYDKEVFSRRIIFPIRDIAGNLTHFTGRYLGDIKKDDKGDDLWPRWKHSTTDAVAGTGSYLAYEDLIPSFAQRHKPYVILTEGYADAMSLYQLGLPALGTFGLQGILKHASKLQRFSEVIAIYDIDTFDEDHPTYPLEYKSWRVILPQLVDLQLMIPSTRISLFFLPGEGKHRRTGALYEAKDVNEWVTGSGATSSEVRDAIDNGKHDLLSYMIKRYGDDLQYHLSLLRLCVATGRGTEELASKVPDSYGPLEYAMAVFT